MSIQTTPQPTAEQVEALAGRIFMAGLKAVELYTVHLGIQLGLYRALDEGGAQTAAELAARTDLERRYVREWLQSQAISGFVSIDGADVDQDRFTLAPGVRETLIDEVSPAFVGAIPAILPRGRWGHAGTRYELPERGTGPPRATDRVQKSSAR